RWDLVDNTLVLGNTIYSTFDDDDPFDGIVSATSGTNYEGLTVTIDNCEVSADLGLTCEDLEELFSGGRVF
ncbi:MAG: hypothetical protein P8M72_02585, partial [Gammaproteobacteria bacterium]|nr:hypothetical protein [Gammaproteobacteria bacterium]